MHARLIWVVLALCILVFAAAAPSPAVMAGIALTIQQDIQALVQVPPGANNEKLLNSNCHWTPEDPYKWLQMPDVSSTGIDIRLDKADQKPRVLADDFLCTETGRITDVHFWGSWRNDIKGEIEKIRLSFYTDIPDPDGDGPLYSKPGELLWQRDFVRGEFNESLYATLPQGKYEWWWDPANQVLITDGDTQVWQYDICIDPEIAFQQQGNPDQPIVYWLAIAVDIKQEGEPQPQFGWKTRDPDPKAFGGGHFNDDAVWALGTGPAPPWYELRYPEEHPLHPHSLDMAFVLTTTVQNRDWGDAPDPTYRTLASSNGANHVIVPEFHLGSYIDAEPDGQPHPGALGDDLAGIDDEDGVIFTSPLVVGNNATVDVIASIPTGMIGKLDAWVDFNGDGDWADPGEQIFVSVALTNGVNSLAFFVPTGSTTGGTFARFRLSSSGGLPFFGPAPDGEVEDYQVRIDQPEPLRDWGDAPDPTYPTLAASNGANHIVVPGMFLGALIDTEVDGQPSLNADGDDLAGVDDEDGVAFVTPLAPWCKAKIIVTASMPGKLDAWIDFNRNGSWEPAEQFCVARPLLAGANGIVFVVPSWAVPGVTYARFRYSSAGGLQPFGAAPDGEVEDYKVTIKKKPFIISKGLAKKEPPGTEVLLEKNIFSLDFGGRWYFQEPDRSAGIGVAPTESVRRFRSGDVVSCYGITRLDGCEIVVDEYLAWLEDVDDLEPLGQNNRDSGGAVFGYQPGVVDDARTGKPANGLNSIGLYVTLWGKVTCAIDHGNNVWDIWLDDGSNLWDGSWCPNNQPAIGVKVRALVSGSPLPPMPGIGEYWVATGVMRAELKGSLGCARWLWTNYSSVGMPSMRRVDVPTP